MAAAIIPVLVAAAPVLRPIIKSLVKGVQNIFGHNNGTGQTKAATVIDAVMTVVDKLSTAGKIPGTLDPASIATMVEAIVQEMKSNGELPPSEGQPVVAPVPVSVATVAGGRQVTIVGVIYEGVK